MAATLDWTSRRTLFANSSPLLLAPTCRMPRSRGFARGHHRRRTPGWAHTAIRVYVPEVMGTFVRYFVVFLFLPGLYLRPDSGATNMRRDRLTRFVRRRTYVRLHLRSSVRPSVHPFADPFVRSFIRSFSSIISLSLPLTLFRARRFYIHYNLRGWRRRCHPPRFYHVSRHVNRE